MDTTVDVRAVTAVPMPREFPSKAVLDAYVVEQLRELLKEDASGHRKWNQTTLAQAIGVTKGAISLIMRSGRGVGARTITGLQSVLGISRDQLDQAALDWAKTQPELRHVEMDDRYPGRQAAAKFAAEAGISQEAIRAVQALRAKSDKDPGALFWLDQMRARQSELEARIEREDEPSTDEPADT